MAERRVEDIKYIRRFFRGTTCRGKRDELGKELELLQQDAVSEIFKEGAYLEDPVPENISSLPTPDSFVPYTDKEEILDVLDKAIGDRNSPIFRNIFLPLKQQFMDDAVDGGLFGVQNIREMAFIKLMIFLALPTPPIGEKAHRDYTMSFATVQQQTKSFYYKRMLRELVLLYEPKETEEDPDTAPVDFSCLLYPPLPMDFTCFMYPRNMLSSSQLKKTEKHPDIGFSLINYMKTGNTKANVLAISYTTTEAVKYLHGETASVSKIIQEIQEEAEKDPVSDLRDPYHEQLVDIIDTYMTTKLDTLFRNNGQTHPSFAIEFEKKIRGIIVDHLDEDPLYLDIAVSRLCDKIAPWIFYIRSVLRGQPDYNLITLMNISMYPFSRIFALELIHSLCQAK